MARLLSEQIAELEAAFDRIEALEVRVARETTANGELVRTDAPQEQPSGAVFQRLRTVLHGRQVGSSDES